ncbi:TadA family conjugal transfer-associated ATPase [Spiractinospora alimapuensis]|uniref:TadA family conjugal transfer-associated ATPase n=1 Tax=Spiractinospora alimapuensis TaxID=2820884 RepID=UPI001F2773C0|nr:TadA family conjugal transfer-associated ATPase [Spiractinospora alimapuensis]
MSQPDLPGRPGDPQLLERVRARLLGQAGPATPSRVAAAVRAEGEILGDAEVLALSRELGAELTGAGPLEPLLGRPEITDILVNGPHEVWIEAGRGLERVPEVSFPDDDAVRSLAQRLAAQAGRRLDAAAPWIDARLTSGARFHAVLAPLSPGGTCLSLRLPRRRVFTLAELVAAHGLPPEGAEILRGIVAARLPFLICGGTGSGKTTLLSALLSVVAPSERLILVEDAPELRPDHPHVVQLQTRPANIEDRGGVEIHHLVRQALRMRPDRLVVGEVRGPEVTSLLNALNTGHEGGACTLHANTAADVPARLEALGCAAGLSRAAVHSQLAATRVVVAHLTRSDTGTRRLAEICCLARDPTGVVQSVPAATFNPTGALTPGPAWPELCRRLQGHWTPVEVPR